MSAPSALQHAAELLVDAYSRGAANGGSADWSDLDDAYAAAVEALPADVVSHIRSRHGLDSEGELAEADV